MEKSSSDKTTSDENTSDARSAAASNTFVAIPAALSAVRARIEKSEREYARLPGSVQLLAVSKTQPALAVQRAYDAGQRQFGENYLQEALAKMDQLPPDITWHFIGPIQSNKTRPIAASFSWVHTVERLKIAQRLSEQRPPELGPLNICLQVNISGEASKSGVTPEELPALAQAVAALPNLRLRGLMAIPEPQEDPELQREPTAGSRRAEPAARSPSAAARAPSRPRRGSRRPRRSRSRASSS